MKFSAIPLLSLLAMACALVITEPKEGAEIKRSESVTVAWTFVPTDPTNFTLSIRQQGDSSAKAVKALQGVFLVKDKQATIEGSVFPNEGKYTIYAVSTDSKNGILAESHVFKVKGPVKTTSSSSTPAEKSGISKTSTDSTGSSAPTTTTPTTTTTTTTTKASQSLASATTVSAGFLMVAGVLASLVL